MSLFEEQSFFAAVAFAIRSSGEVDCGISPRRIPVVKQSGIPM
jgi:hypothetical protein